MHGDGSRRKCRSAAVPRSSLSGLYVFPTLRISDWSSGPDRVRQSPTAGLIAIVASLSGRHAAASTCREADLEIDLFSDSEHAVMERTRVERSDADDGLSALSQ